LSIKEQLSRRHFFYGLAGTAVSTLFRAEFSPLKTLAAPVPAGSICITISARLAGLSELWK